MNLVFGDRFKVIDDNFSMMYEKLGYGNSHEFLLIVNDNGNLYYKIINDKDDTISPCNTDDTFYAKLIRTKALIILTDLLNSGVIVSIEEV